MRETTINNIAIGDDVYYKRNVSDGWHGPAKVILIDKKIATVRHGGATLRVHAVSLRRAPEANNEDTVVNSRNVQKGAGNPPNERSPTERTEMSQDGANLDIGQVPGDIVENENIEQGEGKEMSIQKKRDLDEKELKPRKK